MSQYDPDSPTMVVLTLERPGMSSCSVCEAAVPDCWEIPGGLLVFGTLAAL